MRNICRTCVDSGVGQADPILRSLASAVQEHNVEKAKKKKVKPVEDIEDGETLGKEKRKQEENGEGHSKKKRKKA